MRCQLGILAAVSLLAVLATPSASAEAPDPGGDEEAIVSVPPPAGKAFGFNDHAMLLQSRNVPAATVAEITKAAGANIQRITVNWQEVEPVQDSTSEAAWDRYEAVAAAFRARGQRLLVTLSPAPPWARDAGLPRLCSSGFGCTYPPAQHMLGEWAEYVQEVVRRIPDAVIETWNEPNTYQFWKPHPQPERWARLHAATYAAAKSVDPATTVLAGGVTGTIKSDSINDMTVYRFLLRAYGTGQLRNTVDALSIHLYSDNERPMGEDSLFAESLFELRSARDANGQKSKPIWVTETGLSTSGNWALSPEKQADGLIRRYKRLMTMPDVDGMIIHTALDQHERSPSDRAFGFGVVANHSPFVVKPAFCEFAGRASANPPGGCERIVEVAPTTPGGEIDIDDPAFDGFVERAPKPLKTKAKSRCRTWSKTLKKFRKASKRKRERMILRCVGRYLSVHLADRGALNERVLRGSRKACKRKVSRIVMRKGRRGRSFARSKRRRIKHRCTGRRSLRELKRVHAAL